MQGSQSTARSLRLQSQQLPTESQVFEDEVLPGTESADHPPKEVPERHDHGKNLIGKVRLELCAKSFILRVYDVLARHRLSAGGVADEWVTQMLRQSDAQVFKKYSQMKLQMKREALVKLNRRANEMAPVAADALMAAPMCTVAVQ